MDACASMGRLPLPDGWAVAAGSAHKWGGPAGVGRAAGPQGRPLAQPVPRRRPGRRAGRAASRTSRPRWPPPPPSRRSSPSATRSTPASTPWSTGSGPAWRAIPDAEVVGDPVDRLPHLVTFSCLYVDGEALVDALDRRGFGVASGSACTASTLEPSHVLAAMGALTHGNVRVSLTRDTTEADVDGVPGRAPRGRGRDPRGRRAVTASTSSWTAAGCSARCRSSSWPSGSARSRSARSSRVVADRRGRGRTTSRRGAGCGGRSTSARTAPTTACRATWCGGSAERRRGAGGPRRPRSPP